MKRLDMGEAIETFSSSFDDDMVLAALLIRNRSSSLLICSW